MRLAILTTLWGRPALTRLMLEHTAGLMGELSAFGFELVPVAVMSLEDEDRPRTPLVSGWTYVEAPNMPISDKWNAGAAYLEGLDVDAMMILGSDDFVNAAFIRFAASAIQAGADYFMPKTLWFYDSQNRAAFYVPHIGGRCGGGRTLSRSLLERLSYRPWEPGCMRLSDRAMDRELERVGMPKPDALLLAADRTDEALIGVKSERNEHTYEAMRLGLHGVDVPARALLDQYIPNMADRLWNLAI